MKTEVDLNTLCDIIPEYLSSLRLITSTVASYSLRSSSQLSLCLCLADSTLEKSAQVLKLMLMNDNFVILIIFIDFFNPAFMNKEDCVYCSTLF